MKKIFPILLLLSVLQGKLVYGAADILSLGNGSSGALTVNSANTVINTCTRVTAAVPAGQSFITVATTTGFSVGNLVMVWQSSGYTSTVISGAQAAVALSDKTGAWEFARIQSLTATRLNFSSPLIGGFTATGAQAVRIPEYTSVTINAGASIVAPAWNGTTGGIIAFLATGTVTNNGVITASGRGFRSGLTQTDISGTTGATALDLTPPQGGQKGEGIVPGRYNQTSLGGGRGNILNAGGGGVAAKSGGGGGGNAGSGGNGGRSESADLSRNVGGLGGVELVYDQTNRLLLGGGGGAGHNIDGTGFDGGIGGGVVFFRANALAGTGPITANGDAAPASSLDAGSGGGAGGNIYVRLSGAAACGSFSAVGGKGGDATTAETGTGGGGGGGGILFQSASGTCLPVIANVSGGSSGVQPQAAAQDGLTYGAVAGNVGDIVILSGGLPVMSVTITAPAASVTTIRRPTIAGTATAGSTVTIVIDGTITYTAIADAGGNYAYQLSNAESLSDGSHTLSVSASYQGLSSSTVQRNFSTLAALPIVLMSFDAREQYGHVLLSWKTANEKNSHEFIVERSEEGLTFRQIDLQQAAGDAVMERSYSSTDPEPHDGMNYYRLKITDKDGSYRYSKVVTVKLNVKPSVRITQNPVHNYATILVNTETGVEAGLTLVNADGRVVRTFRLEAGKAEQRIQLERGDLRPGSYYLDLHNSNHVRLAVEKLVIE